MFDTGLRTQNTALGCCSRCLLSPFLAAPDRLVLSPYLPRCQSDCKGYDGSTHVWGRTGSFLNRSPFPQSGPLIQEPINHGGVFHAYFLVEKPPACTILNFARSFTILKVAQHGDKHFVVGRVQVI